MKSFYAYLVIGVVALALFASCSRSDYAFNNGHAYHSSAGAKRTVTPAESPVVEADPVADLTAAIENPLTPVDNPAHTAATTLATAPAANAHALVSATKTAAVADYKAERKEAKAMVKQLKKNRTATADGEPTTQGKSQLVALLLVILIGGLGIHRFYLGYIGIGIAQLLTLGGCGIWALIDLVRIATGDLKPKDADYDKKL